jgi:hypothetical protein
MMNEAGRAHNQPTALRFDPRNDLFAEYLPAFFVRTVIARWPVVHDISLR